MTSKQLPEKPTIEGIEQRWLEYWEKSGTYSFQRSGKRDGIYSIDTPPPTVSGSLHVGHVFSYTHTDIIARYKRMQGFDVFYPMGFDDNGLPTERRVQNYYGVRCDPSIPYDPDFQPPEKPPKQFISISRPNFIELCERLTAEDEKVFEELWRYLGLSVDWSLIYTTIGDRARQVSQAAFLRLQQKNLAYSLEAPTMWDVDFRTAVSQAELEDRERPGKYHRLLFKRPDGSNFEIDTTRPELLPACVAVVVHPDDERYKSLLGSELTTPLFGVKVPVVAHHLADPEKGTGAAMICTFGDVTDVVWWRELNLPARPVMRMDGKLAAIEWGTEGWESIDPQRAATNYAEIEGLRSGPARERIAKLLEEAGELDPSATREITHHVKFFEKGDKPLEIVTTRQWFIRTMDGTEEFLKHGSELNWYPDYMRVRFENWVGGLAGDWCVSRQRFFGVPIPVWYPLDQDLNPDYSKPILPSEDQLPIDPSSEVPSGYSADQRGKPGGFIEEADVMDTWATSSLTPQIATGWLNDPELFEQTFPMDLRPQAHDIIRTWLFSTVVRSHFEHGQLPWKNAAISGWVLDPDRKKMSKSKGNVVTPRAMLEDYGSDAVRYWAARGRPGVDTAFEVAQMKIGRKLVVKLLNASKFVLAGEGPVGEVTVSTDKLMLAKLADVVQSATEALERYDYTAALEATERFFWWFCDDYIELVKGRSYGAFGEEAAASANAALEQALVTMLKLFAPYLPFVAEEIWSWWQEGSVHSQRWPAPEKITDVSSSENKEKSTQAERLFTAIGAVLADVRKAKSTAGVPLKTEVSQLEIACLQEQLELLKLAEDDIKSASRAEAVSFTVADALSVSFQLDIAETN